MADQLAIWNVALAHLGERRLAVLTEPREPARVLNDEWVAAVTGCLQMAAWSFATRTQQVNMTGAGAGPFANRLPKPADWLRTADIAADAALTVPLDGYLEEGGSWNAAPAAIWVRYVSSDPAYGFNVAGWHQPFADLVALALAARACRRLTGAADMLGELIKLREQASQEALTYEEQTAARQYPAPTGAGENRLQAYNDALAHLGRARVYSLTQATDAVRELNDQYRGAMRWCLQRAPWAFAAVTAALAVVPGVAARVGFANAMAKPVDHILTLNVAQDGDLQVPVPRYVEEGGYFYADPAGLVIRYISANVGADPTRWPPLFCDLLALRLAEVSAGRLAQDPKDVLPAVVKMRQDAEAAAQASESESVARVYPAGSAAVSQVQAYNNALAHLGLPRIGSLTEVGEIVRALNDQFRTVALWCLQQAPWTWAVRVQAFAPVDNNPPAAYSRTFTKPSDWIETLDLAIDFQVSQPLTNYVEESGHWYASTEQLVARYVSSDTAYGMNTALWTPRFVDLLALRLAELCAGRLGATALLAAITEKRAAAQQSAADDEAAHAARVFGIDAITDTRVQAYNDALAYLGRKRIASLTQTTEVVRELNDQYFPAVLWCLERGAWSFAAVTVDLQAEASATERAGYANAYLLPSDHVRTLDVAADNQLQAAVSDYIEEGGRICAGVPNVAIRYVSSARGADPSRWPPHFRVLLALRLAEMLYGRLAQDPKTPWADLVKMREEALASAVRYEIENVARVLPAATAALTQLRIYNAALAYTGRMRIASLTDASLPVRLLNEAWGVTVRWALEQGPWTWAIRAIMIGPFGDTVPTFGYRNAFKKPDDWLQTVLVSEYDDFRSGSTGYADETGWWFSDAPGLFVRYVSTGPNYGMNLQQWSPAFGDLLALRLAELIAPQLGLNQGQIAGLVALRQQAMKQLRASDALNTPPVFPPEGAWVQARRGGWRAGKRFGDGPGGPSVPLTGDTTLSGDSDLPINNDFVPRISG